MAESIKPASTTFFDLPAELRNAIYTYALIQNDPIILPYAFKKTAFPEPALLRSSRWIRTEAAAIFYGCNIFEAPSPPSAHQFLEQLDLQTIAMIRAFRPIDLIVPLSAHRRWFDAMRTNINRLVTECSNGGLLRPEAIQVPVRDDAGRAYWCQLQDVADFKVVYSETGLWHVQWSDGVAWQFVVR